jgi:hypothetical protein
MPEIDLPPSKYRWRRPLSLPLAWTFVGLGALMLGWLYWVRDNVSSTNLFVGTAMVAFAVGLILAGIMRNID